ncbi:hypothetical protein [Vibrio agarivorans]|uniref:hypothetical protein n=1 Tax=Vibrio agarivorans TaxID=153622 RepID=UPI0025B3AAB5|nr:hypothetical protein [Vibrio agarivorans]MDN3661129.1 hypothetical protein [Vibrio agarivorans]
MNRQTATTLTHLINLHHGSDTARLYDTWMGRKNQDTKQTGIIINKVCLERENPIPLAKQAIEKEIEENGIPIDVIEELSIALKKANFDFHGYDMIMY